ncbi:hypothetical protein EVAR_55665_1 [Eumeta japonica]|uniref:Mariner Mos1 transposase n=1 Tax=Eumeta variegata TaxID=151549 RepID=A0A4C1Y149_EUMVA|nr:hypothetical protein EVAR_55665_1 [Eumeta japonica]
MDDRVCVSSFNTPNGLVDVTVCVFLRMCLVDMKLTNFHDHQSTAVNNKHIEAVRGMIETNRHLTYHEIRAFLCIGKSQIQSILRKQSGMKSCARGYSLDGFNAIDRPQPGAFVASAACEIPIGLAGRLRRGRSKLKRTTAPSGVHARCHRHYSPRIAAGVNLAARPRRPKSRTRNCSLCKN